MIDPSEIALRLTVATLAGGAIGLNRDLHGKPIGVRTLGLVGLATAMVVLLASPHVTVQSISDPTSRVLQGILTGIGFLGAGVIVRSGHHQVHGLTSAASVWFTACAGAASGAGEWALVAIGVVLALLLLMFGGPAERYLHRLRGGDHESSEGPHQPGK